MKKDTVTVTKRDLVVDICNELGRSDSGGKGEKGNISKHITQQMVFAVIKSFIDHVTKDLAQGNEVVLRNFGTFEVIETKAKVGRNPRQPDKEVTIPPRKVVKFRPGKELKEEVAKLLPGAGRTQRDR